MVRSVFSYTMVKGHRVSNRIERKLVRSARKLPNSILNIFMNTNSIAANHFVQLCRLFCTFAVLIKSISVFSGDDLSHRSRATEKEHCHFLSTNELI